MTNMSTREINDEILTEIWLDVANALTSDDIFSRFLTIEVLSALQRAAITFIAYMLKVLLVMIDYFIWLILF